MFTDMLTAKIGKETINILDNIYDRYRLKQWSDKKVIKCPICDGEYEYCHGDVVDPYFRHVKKECTVYYSESESEEHIKGKKLLYQWIKEQKGVSNVQLEHWIPETKQRPDIYFEYDNNRYVIEFQCTPIASEYLVRKELYKLAGIIDIWILGIDKYKIKVTSNGDVINGVRLKTIEKELYNQSNIFYLDVNKKALITNSNPFNIDKEFSKVISEVQYHSSIVKFDLFKKYHLAKDFLFTEHLNNFVFKNRITLNSEIISLIDLVKDKYLTEYKQVEILKKRKAEELRLIKEKIDESEKISNYLGNIGDILETNVLLVDTNYFYFYDSTLYKFLDKNGNIITLFSTSSYSIKIGDYVLLKGKIKSHSEYKGVKNTRVVQCEILKEMIN